jgi:hypothetical protein
MSDIDTTKIGAALELIIDAASQHAVDRVSAGRLALYGELRTALTAAEARGAQRERARCIDSLEGARLALLDAAPADPSGLQEAYLAGAGRMREGVMRLITQPDAAVQP